MPEDAEKSSNIDRIQCPFCKIKMTRVDAVTWQCSTCKFKVAPMGVEE